MLSDIRTLFCFASSTLSYRPTCLSSILEYETFAPASSKSFISFFDISRFTSFSNILLGPIVPFSFPPCPASIKMFSPFNGYVSSIFSGNFAFLNIRVFSS